MADVPESTDLIQTESVQFRAAASESTMTLIAGDINYCLARATQNANILLKTVKFNTAGSGTWAAPANLAGGFVIAFGAGGAGGGGDINSGVGTLAQGGGGSNFASMVILVTAGNSYAYTVGAGGVAAIVNGGNGATGDSTIFNSIAVGAGGHGGIGFTQLSALNTIDAYKGFGYGGSGGDPGFISGSGGGGFGNAANGGTAGASPLPGGHGVLTLVWFENPTVLL